MKPIESAYLNALLADASYAVNPALTLGDQKTALEKRMTVTQAKFIADNFEIVNSVETLGGPLGSTGFDATVWRGKTGSNYAGQVYVSTRGTQGMQDNLDDISLALRGIPHQQVADMVNWWLKNTASPSATNVKQIKVKSITDPITGLPIFAYTFELDAPTTGTGLIPNVSTVTSVNGHSLGGYLATAFTRIFGKSADVQSVNTFNSAGFANVASINIDLEYKNIANLIGADAGLPSFGAVASLQTNFFGENGIELTTNSLADFRLPGFNQYGKRQELYQEAGLTGGLVAPIANHFMYKLTDLLALGFALEKLDPTINITKLNEFIKAGSDDMAASYEGVLDALRKVLGGPGITTLTPGDVSASEEPRPTYHATLAELQINPIFTQLTGKLKIELAKRNLGDLARTDFGALIALKDLSPVYISGSTPDAKSLLTEIWQISRASDYAAWQLDKTSPTPSTFTDSWIKDRASLLQAISVRNTNDVTNGLIYDASAPGDRALAFQWTEPRPGELNPSLSTLFYQRQGGTVSKEQAIIFGDDKANTINGTGNALGDRLYGGSGADTLDGKAGADYLEGGADDDTLIGGEGNDSLMGGKGVDIYKFEASFGQDTITDSDGKGLLQINGQTLQGTFIGRGPLGYGLKLADGSGAGISIYDDASSSTGKTAILKFSSNLTNAITIKNFDETAARGSQGYLGIKLDPTQRVALIQGNAQTLGAVTPNGNVWSDTNFTSAQLQGKSSQLKEGNSKTFTVNLALAAKAGDTLKLNVTGAVASDVKAIIDDDAVAAGKENISTLAKNTKNRVSAQYCNTKNDATNTNACRVIKSGCPKTALLCGNSYKRVSAQYWRLHGNACATRRTNSLMRKRLKTLVKIKPTVSTYSLQGA
jgi:trimeric autotransporter adhesin